MPGRSTISSSVAPWNADPIRASTVDPGKFAVLARSPHRRLKSDVLPTFGVPTIATRMGTVVSRVSPIVVAHWGGRSCDDGGSCARHSVALAQSQGRVRILAASSGERPRRVASNRMMQGPPPPALQTVNSLCSSSPIAHSIARSSGERSADDMTARSPFLSWLSGRCAGGRAGGSDTMAGMILRLSRNGNEDREVVCIRSKPGGGPQSARIDRFP